MSFFELKPVQFDIPGSAPQHQPPPHPPPPPQHHHPHHAPYYSPYESPYMQLHGNHQGNHNPMNNVHPQHIIQHIIQPQQHVQYRPQPQQQQTQRPPQQQQQNHHVPHPQYQNGNGHAPPINGHAHQHYIHNHLHPIDSHDSDSQDSMDSIPRPIKQSARRSSAKSTTVVENGNDYDSDGLNEEVRNHWMPMTWIERSSDDPQVFTFICLWDKCVAACSSKQEFEDHLFSHIPSFEDSIKLYRQDEESLPCLVRGCGKHVSSINELQRHVSMHVFQADCQQKGSEALIEKEEYVGIESCGFDPCTNLEYEGMVLTCLWEECGLQFNSLTDLFDHVGAHIDMVNDTDRVEQNFQDGSRKVVYPCKWSGCTQVADSKSNLRRHTRHHSGEKALACPFCARFFSRRDKLYDHCVRRTILMSDPDIEDPYICKLCQKRFGTERALCLHVTRHLVGHTCPLCSLSLSCRAEIHRHLMTKHSRRSKDFQCTTCKKMFFTESELNRHAIYHTDVMYSCKQCQEKFKWKKQLLKHMKEHDEKKRFQEKKRQFGTTRPQKSIRI